jgi:thioredoxin reductase (NADPH)
MDPKPQTALPGSSPNEMFPVLTAEQQARVLTHGRLRRVTAGEVVIEPDNQAIKFFVVVQGKLEILRLSENREQVYAVCGPGMFSGELNMLSGRRSLVRIRASEAGELIEIEREALRGLVQTDSELSDIFLRAFILRRFELIAHGIGEILLMCQIPDGWKAVSLVTKLVSSRPDRICRQKIWPTRIGLYVARHTYSKRVSPASLP